MTIVVGIITILFALVALLVLVSTLWTPGSPSVEDIDTETRLDDDGWEYKVDKGRFTYINGPRKGQLM